MSPAPDPADELDAELRAFLALLGRDGGLREVRALDVVRQNYPHKTKHVETGYFLPNDAESLLLVAGHFRGEPDRKTLPSSDLSLLREQPKGVYVTLNPVKVAARARAPGRIVVADASPTSADTDMERRTRLLIDVDAPREVSSVSASDAEKGRADALAKEIRGYLADRGWPEPIELDSGNGRQLVYAIDMPAADGGLVERVLRGLATRFPRDDGGVDTTVHNPARIMRLPCTWNRKGFDTEDRPHRMARVLSLPRSLDVVEIEKLEAIAALAPTPSESQPKSHPRSRHAGQEGPDTSFEDAAVRWNSDHPRAFPTKGSPCLICGSPDGLKASEGDASRWTCFSSRHDTLADARDKGAGVRGNGCFTGDSLDLEAWASKRTRAEVLTDDGYIGSTGRRRRAKRAERKPEEPDLDTEPGDAREAVLFHTVGGDVPLHELVPRAVELLAAHAADDVYVHAERLSHVVTPSNANDGESRFRRNGAPRIREYPVPVMRELLDEVARWMHEKVNDFGDVKTEERWCPREVVHALRDRGHWPGIRLLKGVSTAPVLRADLTILDKPGYDAATALLYLPGRDYPQVPETPSIDDVAAALDELLEPFADFPFAEEADRATLLAYLLTLAARPAIDGPVPMFGVTARVPGTGKTLLVDSATLAMTGHLPDKLMVPGGRSGDADAEWRKRIATLALEGPRAVLIDNVPDGVMLDSAALATALTADELTERILGTNRTVRVPLRFVWTYSGNNVSTAPDLARRCLSIDLDAQVEDPHLRGTFRVDNLLEYVRTHHPRLLSSALTIWRGFATAGCPKHGLPALGMFEAWDARARACVIWVTKVDPLETQRRLRGENPETASLGALLVAWRDEIGVGRRAQAKDLLGRPALISALSEAVPGRGDRDPPSPKSLGKFLSRNRGRVVDGLRIARVAESTGVTLWAVEEVRP